MGVVPSQLYTAFFVFHFLQLGIPGDYVQARVGWSYLYSNRIKMSHAGTCFTPRMFRVHALAVDPLNTERGRNFRRRDWGVVASPKVYS